MYYSPCNFDHIYPSGEIYLKNVFASNFPCQVLVYVPNSMIAYYRCTFIYIRNSIFNAIAKVDTIATHDYHVRFDGHRRNYANKNLART